MANGNSTLGFTSLKALQENKQKVCLSENIS